MKKRVYHLPLDGCTDIALLEENDLLDFQTQNHIEDDSFDSSSLPFWMSKSSSSKDDQSENDCSTSSLPPFWMSKSYSSGSDSAQSSSSCANMSKSDQDDTEPSSLPLWMSKSLSSGSDSTQSSLCFTMSLSSCSDHSEDCYSEPSSLPFWMSRSSSIEDEDTNPLLEGKGRENQPSFRFQTSDGKELILEVTENTSEPFYELSFRHIVNDDTGTVGSVGDGDDIVIEEDLLGNKAKRDFKVAQVIRKKTLSRDQTILTNNQRINTAVFLLKMFVPVSLRSKAKSKNATNSSKISHKTSFDGIENTLKKQFSEKLEMSNSKGIDGVGITTSQKRLVGGKFLSCFCKMSDSQRYIGNALQSDGYNK